MSELEVSADKGTGIWEQNPVLIQLLGLSPVLGVSSTFVNGFALGVATFLVCVFSCVTTSLFRNYIPHRWRLIWYMLILATYTTIAETLCQLYFYPLFLKLGIYLPLICCNVAILVRMETVSAKAQWPAALFDATRTACGFLIALLLLSTIRELLVSGTLFTQWQLLMPTGSNLAAATSFDDTRLFSFANTQAGALILLGMLIALVNLATLHRSKPAIDEEIPLVKRARVTGRLSKE